MAEERVRIEIAFDGGQIMGANVELSAADALERNGRPRATSWIT